jgi:hypothetical protein
MIWKLKILAASLLVGTAFANPKPLTTANTQAPMPEVKETSKEATFVLPPILVRIAECESGGRQFNKDGSVVRGRENKNDVGKWQINLHWNGAEAKKLGYDLMTEEGNTKMALHLYEKHGTRDWNWSKFCWSK